MKVYIGLARSQYALFTLSAHLLSIDLICRKKKNKVKIPRKISLQTCFYFVKMYLEERSEIEKIKKGVHLMTVDEKLDFLIEGFTEMKLDIKELKEDVSSLKEDVLGLKKDVSEIKVLQENEMWPAIKIIAEGHFGLSRSLENYHKILKEQVAKNEVYDVYIKHLDTKIGELKKA